MAQLDLDTTQNELSSTFLGKLNTMLKELYAGVGGAVTGANSGITELTGLTTPLSIAQGGTAGATAAAARTALAAAKNGANSDITSLTGVTTPLSIAQGGTAGASAAAARTALGAAASGANTDITSLAASGNVGGATVSSTGLATVGSLKLDATATKTGTASAGALTLNTLAGVITTEAYTTAAQGAETVVLTSSKIAAGDQAFVTIDLNGSTGIPLVISAKCTTNTLTIIIKNAAPVGGDAFNAALKLAFMVLKN